ncbi:MAG: hypothetical protein ISR43_05670 [Acidimicrobiia bacterium]|nr:hypothetical protein [Actinomycetota bacterium]MBL6925228.1 hypothetical protein [Acidimicrobiia bacterium]MBL6926701.1 hypothetical protein [Acidimicrobiia bacterium]
MTTTTERRPRRRHPAIGTRIAAAGVATTAMLTMVAALGYQSAQTQVIGSEAPVPTAQMTPITVVVYRRPTPQSAVMPASTGTAVATTGATAPTITPSQSPTPTEAAPEQPVMIQLQPSVRTVVQAPASTRTNGSR